MPKFRIIHEIDAADRYDALNLASDHRAIKSKYGKIEHTRILTIGPKKPRQLWKVLRNGQPIMGMHAQTKTGAIKLIRYYNKNRIAYGVFTMQPI